MRNTKRGNVIKLYPGRSLNEKIDVEKRYTNIYPLLKHNGACEGTELYHKKAFENIDIVYAVDQGENFELILKDDNCDFGAIETASEENINKLSNALVRLAGEEVYQTKYQTDYAPSLMLSKEFQKVIKRIVGRKYYFILPNPTILIIAKYQQHTADYYLRLLQFLLEKSENEYKISDDVYLLDDGKISIVAKGRYMFNFKLGNKIDIKQERILKSREFLMHITPDFDNKKADSIWFGKQMDNFTDILKTKDNEEILQMFKKYISTKSVETIKLKQEYDWKKQVDELHTVEGGLINIHRIINKIPSTDMYYSENIDELISDFKVFYENNY